MPIYQVLRLGRGAIIELDACEQDAVSILQGYRCRERQPYRRQCGRIAPVTAKYALSGRSQGAEVAPNLSQAGVGAGLVPQHPIC